MQDSAPAQGTTQAPPPTAQPSQTAPAASQPAEPLDHWLFVLGNYLRYIWSKVLVIILTLYSFYALWRSVLFMAIEYPSLQERYSANLITAQELNLVLADAALTVVATVVSGVFAIRLSSKTTRVMHWLDLIITSGLIFGHNHLRQWLLAQEEVARWHEYLPF